MPPANDASSETFTRWSSSRRLTPSDARTTFGASKSGSKTVTLGVAEREGAGGPSHSVGIDAGSLRYDAQSGVGTDDPVQTSWSWPLGNPVASRARPKR